MQTIILAGGKGTRLRPYTMALPKPLVPVGDYPILDIIIRQLSRYGIRDIIISTGHLAELVEAYFGNGLKWGVHIRYVREDRPLGTAGAIKNIKRLDDNFLVMNGDTLTDIDYRKVVDFHLKHKAKATITAARRDAMVDFGVLEIDESSKLIDYTEKPRHTHHVSIGINVLNKSCKQYIQSGESLGMPELLLRMKENGEAVYCYKTDAYWLDIGRIEDYQLAQETFERNKTRFLRQ